MALLYVARRRLPKREALNFQDVWSVCAVEKVIMWEDYKYVQTLFTFIRVLEMTVLRFKYGIFIGC